MNRQYRAKGSEMKICKECGLVADSSVKFHGRVCYGCRAKIRSAEDANKAHKEIERLRSGDGHRKASLSYYYKLRNQAFEYYGWKCACCEETEPYFLSIDHVKGHGNRHRRELGMKSQGSGAGFYKWLKDEGYPKDYQVLCMNCNHGKMRNKGICPHELSKCNDYSERKYNQAVGSAQLPNYEYLGMMI